MRACLSYQEFSVKPAYIMKMFSRRPRGFLFLYLVFYETEKAPSFIPV